MLIHTMCSINRSDEFFVQASATFGMSAYQFIMFYIFRSATFTDTRPHSPGAFAFSDSKTVTSYCQTFKTLMGQILHNDISIAHWEVIA